MPGAPARLYVRRPRRIHPPRTQVLFLAVVLGLSAAGSAVLWFPSALWFIYRIVHGWLRLNDGDRV